MKKNIPWWEEQEIEQKRKEGIEWWEKLKKQDKIRKINEKIDKILKEDEKTVREYRLRIRVLEDAINEEIKKIEQKRKRLCTVIILDGVSGLNLTGEEKNIRDQIRTQIMNEANYGLTENG